MKNLLYYIKNGIATEDINESLLSRKKNKDTAFKSKDQQWDHWCAKIIQGLVYGFKKYKTKNPDYVPQNDISPENFVEEVIGYANDNGDFSDVINCLYRCYYNSDFTEDDLGNPGLAKVKFIN